MRARSWSAACAASIVAFHVSPASARAGARWVATWTTSPTAATDSEGLIRWNGDGYRLMGELIDQRLFQ